MNVAQRARTPVDVSDIKDRIENCRNDVAWRELALSAKIRVLLIERLEQIENDQAQE